MNEIIKDFNNKVIGILKSPTQTLGKLMNEKKWLDVLAILLFATFIFNFLTSKVLFQIGFEENPELYTNLPHKIGILGQIFMGFTASFVYFIRITVVTFFIYLFYSIFGVEAIFSNFFSLVTNIFLITALIPEFITSIYLLIFHKVVNPFNLGIFFNFEKSNWLKYILAEIDFFQILFIILISYGVFGYFEINKENFEEQRFSLNKSFMVGILYFIFKSAIIILFSYLFAKFSSAASQLLINN